MFRVGLSKRFFFTFLGALVFSGWAAMAQTTNPGSPDQSPNPTPSVQSGGAVDPLKRPVSEKQKKENAKSLRQELGKTYKK